MAKRSDRISFKSWNLFKFYVLNFEYILKFNLQFIINLSLNSSCRTQPIENKMGCAEATSADVSRVNVSGSKISGSNVNLGKQGDVVSGVHGDFVKGVQGDLIKGVQGDFIRGDRGGDGGNSYNGGFGGVGGPAKGNNTITYGQK